MSVALAMSSLMNFWIHKTKKTVSKGAGSGRFKVKV